MLGDQDGWGTNRLSKAESILGPMPPTLGGFIDPPPTDPAPAATIGRGLEGYGTVTAADREVGHDLH